MNDRGESDPRRSQEPAEPPPPTPPHWEIICKAEKNWWDERKPFVEIGGVVLLAVYTCFTILMYFANKTAANAAKTAAGAAVMQVGIAGRSLDAAIQQFHLEQRAWVSVPRFILDREPTENGSITVLCVLVNSGKTPALNTRDQFRLSIRPDQPAEPDWTKAKISAPLVLPPEVSPNSFWIPAKQDAIPKLAADLYKAGINKIWVRTFVSYSDVFGRPHWVKTCSFHTVGMPLNDFTGCDDGNAVDTEDKNEKLPN